MIRGLQRVWKLDKKQRMVFNCESGIRSPPPSNDIEHIESSSYNGIAVIKVFPPAGGVGGAVAWRRSRRLPDGVARDAAGHDTAMVTATTPRTVPIPPVRHQQ